MSNPERHNRLDRIINGLHITLIVTGLFATIFSAIFIIMMACDLSNLDAMQRTATCAIIAFLVATVVLLLGLALEWVAKRLSVPLEPYFGYFAREFWSETCKKFANWGLVRFVRRFLRSD